MSEATALDQNPYVGLRPFFLEDSLYFFGRDQQTSELLETLHRERFLSVVGSSGCGKSSIVRAGLIPMLLGGFLVQDRDKWSIVRMKPGDAPMSNLAAGLAGINGSAGDKEEFESLEKTIREGDAIGVVEFARSRLKPNENLLILVDQFEEIFAFRKNEDQETFDLSASKRKDRSRRRAEAAEFVDLLLRLSERRDLPIYVTKTMRTDFLGDCDVFYGLPEAMNRGRYLVPRLTRQQLREAIHGPVLLMREKIAPRLLDHLLNELGDRSDRLPVLQHALLRTWDAWRGEGGVGPLDVRHFEKAGGLDGALAQDAKRALEGLDIEATARIFKCLTDTDISQRRIRRPARVSELAAVSGISAEEVGNVVSRFGSDRRNFLFTSADGNPDDPRVDMAHESLIRQWDDLRGWVDEERSSRDQFLELVERGRGGKAKMQNPDLQFALDWRAVLKPTRPWAQRYSRQADDFDVAMTYLDESRDEAQAEAVRERELAEKEKRLAIEERERLEEDIARRKKMSRITGVATFVFAASAVFAGWQWFDAAQARREQARAMGLANASEEVVTNSATMTGLWEDDGVADDHVTRMYANLLEPLKKPEGLENTWQRRLGSLADWKAAVEAAMAVDEDPDATIPEKAAAWQGILSRRSPRTGPDTDSTIAAARRQFDSRRAILTSSVEVREGTFAMCRRNGTSACPQKPSCTGVSVVEGDRACLYAGFDTHDAVGGLPGRTARLTWINTEDNSTLDTNVFDKILGRSFDVYYTPPYRSIVPKSSQIRILNANGDLIYRQAIPDDRSTSQNRP